MLSGNCQMQGITGTQAKCIPIGEIRSGVKLLLGDWKDCQTCTAQAAVARE